MNAVCPACKKEPVVTRRYDGVFGAYHKCDETPRAYFELTDGYDTPEAALEAFGKVMRLVQGPEPTTPHAP